MKALSWKKTVRGALGLVALEGALWALASAANAAHEESILRKAAGESAHERHRIRRKL